MVRKILALSVLLASFTLGMPTFASAPAPTATPVGAPTSTQLPMSFCDIFTPNFEVVPVYNKPAMDHSLGTADMFSPESPLGDGIGHQSGKTKIRATPVFGMASEGAETCIFMEEVTVVFSIDSTVRIPNEFPDGSCEYKQIVAHENRHMAATTDFITQTLPSLKTYLEEQMRGQGGTGMGRRRQEEAQIYLQQVLDRKLAAYSRYLNDEYRKLHQTVIDSPEEMKKVYAVCPNGWKRNKAE
jgi:hypothetical protein